MNGESMTLTSLLVWATVLCTAVAAPILLWYLIVQPPLVWATRVLLLFGIGVLPLVVAFTGNVASFEQSKEVQFCNGCHVMEPYVDDARDRDSSSLASQHSRNRLFGHQSCYTCHSDYGMFGAVTTKINGLLHLWAYYDKYRDVDAEEAVPHIELYRPFPNVNCMKCHSTELEDFLEEHDMVIEDIRTGEMSCADDGCHGPAHPLKEAAGSGGDSAR